MVMFVASSKKNVKMFAQCLCLLFVYCSTDRHWILLEHMMEFSSRKKLIEMSSFLMPLCYVTGKYKTFNLLIQFTCTACLFVRVD